jgi:uncharacterized protein YjbI with pentapeptide repeats
MMMNNGSDPNGSLDARRGFDPSGLALKEFEDGADLTAMVLMDVSIEAASAQQSLLSGVLFRNCTFTRCNFQRADFEGAVFETCRFDACDFSIADLRSIESVRTSFVDCIFADGSIRSCSFETCHFERSRFGGQTFEENRIRHSTIIDCQFQQSTMLHCQFLLTRFERTNLSDCTSQFHTFDNCTFFESSLNAEAIGLTFGLTLENLRNIDLVWRGRILGRHDAAHWLPIDLVTTYQVRKWFFAAAIVKLNFGLEYRATALSEVFSALTTSAGSSLPVKADDVRFFAAVIEFLSSKGKLPFLSIASGLDTVVEWTETRGVGDNTALKLLFHALKDAEHAELAALDEKVAPLVDASSPTETLLVTFVFSEEPALSFQHWLEYLHSNRLLFGPAPRFKSATRGSYLEIFFMTAGILAGLLVCLTLVERIVDRLVWIRARGAVLTSEKLPAAVRRRALQPISVASPSLVRELRSCLDYAKGPKGDEFVSQAQRFLEKLTKIEVSEERRSS